MNSLVRIDDAVHDRPGTEAYVAVQDPGVLRERWYAHADLYDLLHARIGDDIPGACERDDR